MEIKGIPEDNIVVIGQNVIEGHIGKNTCTSCNNQLIYYDQFDTFFCAHCNEWKEKKCNDINCEYCNNRPERPLILN